MPNDVISKNDLLSFLATEYIATKNHNFFVSVGNQNIEYSHYQYRPLAKLLEEQISGLLIADDVGIGKTIETGIIIKQLMYRDSIKNVLILCPSELIGKWKDELLSKFGLDFHFLSLQQFFVLVKDRNDGKNVQPSFVICSIQSFSRYDNFFKDIPNNILFDLMVVDEAHHLRNHNSKSTTFLNKLRSTTKKIVLLSATPIQTKMRDLHTLLNLLDTNNFKDFKAFSEIAGCREQITKTINLLKTYRQTDNREIHDHIRTIFNKIDLDGQPSYYNVGAIERHNVMESFLSKKNQIELIQSFDTDKEVTPEIVHNLLTNLQKINLIPKHMTRTIRREIGRFTTRDVGTIHCKFTKEQKEFYSLALEFIKTIINKENELRAKKNKTKIPVGFICSSCERLMASSIFAFCQKQHIDNFIHNKISNLVKEINENNEEQIQDIEHYSTNNPTVKKLTKLAGVILLQKDEKLSKLLDYLKQANEAVNNKILLFSASLNSIAYLFKHITSALPNVRTQIITGVTEKFKREEIRRRFKLKKDDSKAIDLLICSEIGSEGLDFQFCDKIVNYDIPWNPMKIEQRIGRIDRRGQTSPLVRVISFLTNETVEETIYSRCFERIELFNQHIGGLEHVIGDIDKKVTKILFTEEYSAKKRHGALEQIFSDVISEKFKL